MSAAVNSGVEVDAPQEPKDATDVFQTVPGERRFETAGLASRPGRRGSRVRVRRASSSLGHLEWLESLSDLKTSRDDHGD